MTVEIRDDIFFKLGALARENGMYTAPIIINAICEEYLRGEPMKLDALKTQKLIANSAKDWRYTETYRHCCM